MSIFERGPKVPAAQKSRGMEGHRSIVPVPDVTAHELPVADVGQNEKRKRYNVRKG